MSVSVVIGGQFGSEGKGKVSYYFAKKYNASAVVRVGGTNSGHTVIGADHNEYIFRTLPTASVEKNIVSLLPSGSYIDLNVLRDEIALSAISANMLKIDPYAVIVDEDMRSEEVSSNLRESIGSTTSGTGAAVIRRIARNGKISFAKDISWLKDYIFDTKAYMRTLLNEGKHIVVEGTQGFGLSPINSEFYPYCTSRDTTAGTFIAEAGLSPLDIENVIMAIRAYPIRVGGESGPLLNETDWDSVSRTSGADCDLTEHTSATNRIRRVGEFDADIVKKAIRVNRPNIIVMNHIDYIDYSCHDNEDFSDAVLSFVNKVSSEIGQNIDYLGSGKALLVENRGDING
jgi:adenylosuccinate synthase